MLKKPLSSKSVEKLSQLIAASQRIVITAHIAPDGDAIGSSLAMYHLLGDLGKEAAVIVPDTFNSNLSVLPGASDITIYSRHEKYACELIERADLIMCLDYNAIKRIDHMAQTVMDSKAPKALIDHHLDPETFPDITISDPSESSTCALLFKVICALGLAPLVDKRIGSCIYAGMMTDTGNFSYNSNDPDLYNIIAFLVEAGIDKDALCRSIMHTSTLSRLKITSYALDCKLRLYPQHRASLITLTRKELNERNYHKADTESLVNIPLELDEVTYSFYLREEENYIKVSSRSKGNFPVNDVCARFFNGGGHRNAAGGEFYGTMEECIKAFENSFSYNDKLLQE